MPFTKVLSQISTHVKFLKETLSKNRKLEEYEVMEMTATSNVVIQSMPPKLRDPRSFLILCKLGTMEFNIALCGL